MPSRKLILTALAALSSVCSAQNQIDSFTLVDADSNTSIAEYVPLIDGSTLNLSALPTTNLDIVANAKDTEGATQSVQFQLSGATNRTHTESGAPYVLGGDAGGNYNGLSFNEGSHTLVATPYSLGGLGGTAGTALTINFTVINEAPTGVDSITLDALTDFPDINAGEVPYYEHVEQNALAINAANVSYRGKFARAEATFSGTAGTYDITLGTLRETDGECEYRLFINGSLIGSVQNAPTPNVDTDYVPQNHVFRDIYVPAGANIAVESATDSNERVLEPDGVTWAWARGRWTSLSFTPPDDSIAPVVDAGDNQIVETPATSAQLNASVTDDGSISAYKWVQLSGPNEATLSGDDSQTLNLSNLTDGSYQFRLYVTDNDSEIGSDNVIVNVGDAASANVISGELKTWHKITVTFDGPMTSETADPNPFRDFRLDVTFTHTDSGESYVVPGYYAADGDAANTSADSGNKWKVHFSPPLTGEWSYVASFVSGTDIAASDAAGSTAGFFDGSFGSFTISATDKTGRDFRGKGWLQYTEEHYPRFKGTGEIFLKQGPDSPENLLTYDDIDDTPNTGGRLKSWSPHSADYQSADASDYTWNGDNGSELLGAIRYLSEDEGMNSISFLTFNIDGDDDNVFPHRLTGSVADYEAVADDQRWDSGTVYKDRFDVSKMAQWENIFSYADKKGVFLHFKTQETENDDRMDGGALGVERKLYYRELIARFSHHLALNWNLGEENTNTEAQRIAFTEYFYALDPYRNPIVLHTWPNSQGRVYSPLLGDASKLSGTSLQLDKDNFEDVHDEVAEWVNASRDAGKPWVVAADEPGAAGSALRPDNSKGNSHEDGRKNALWGTFLAGGWGNEWYFGYNHNNSDLNLQDFRSRDQWWDYCRVALQFFENNPMPLNDMVNDNSVSSATDDYAFFKEGDTYLVYLKNGGTTNLDLSAFGGEFTVQWYDTRNGGALQDGTVTRVTGGSSVDLGEAPSATTEDWLILVQRQKKVAYIYGDVARDGTIPSGSADPYDQMLLTDTGNTGMSDFKALVEAEGYSIDQYYDQDTTLDATFLDQFDVIIFGLHQKDWTGNEKLALDSWLRAGGGMLTYSDSAAGGHWQTVGAQNPVGQTAVNNLISVYGMEVTVDQAAGTTAYTAGAGAAHPVVSGGLVLEGEGVSPVAVDPSSGVITLIPYSNDPAYNVSGTASLDHLQNITIANPTYAALAFSPVGEGLVMALFDRQPLWNNGIGSNIQKRDNEGILRRSIAFLAGDIEASSQAEARISAFPVSGEAPIEVSFDGRGSSPATGSTIISYAWDFQDDGIVDSTSPTATFTYTSAGTFSATLTVTDSFGSTSTDTVTIEVEIQEPFGNGGDAWPLPGRIEAENFDTGGEGLAYSDQTANNQSNADYRLGEGVDIEGASDVDGVYNISWIATGEWLEYTVDVAEAGTYTATFRVASKTNGGTIKLSANGVDKTGNVTFAPTTQWQLYTDVVSAEFTLEPGQQVIRLDIVDGGFNLNWFELSPITGDYDSFIGNYPTLTGDAALPESDPDGDGISNILEQWLALDPTQPSFQQTTAVSTGGSMVNFSYTFDASVTDSSLIFEVSDNLVSWDPLPIEAEWMVEDGNLRHVTVELPIDEEIGRLFQRLRVEYP